VATLSGRRSARFVSEGERIRRLLLRPEPAALGATLLLTLVFSYLSPIFLTTETFVSIGSVAAELGIVAIGMTLLMIGGHFDLSVGAVLGLTSFAVVSLINDYDVAPPLAFVLALLMAAGLGLVNGVILVRARIHSFVITLGTMLVYRGVLIALTGGFPITVAVPPILKTLAAGPILPGRFQMSLLWFVLIGVGATLLLLRTRLGNWIQAMGQNPNAARNLGVPVDRITVLLFVQCALLAGVTGVIQVARFNSVDANRGAGIELQAIAVTVIGGTLLSGGYGSAIGTMLGAVVFGMIQLGLVLASAPGYYFTTLEGTIVVVAVILNTAVTRRVATAAPLGGLLRGAPTMAAPPSAPAGKPTPASHEPDQS
jgi:simple sugar transport system permease protein